MQLFVIMIFFILCITEFHKSSVAAGSILHMILFEKSDSPITKSINVTMYISEPEQGHCGVRP